MSRKSKDNESLRQYLVEANGWETDAVARANRTSKISLVVGVLGIVIGLAGVLAVKGLTPLKQVVPVIIRVDNATGIAEVIDQLTDAKTNYQESVNKYFLQNYVRFREGFNRATAERNYEAVGVMSERGEQTKYYEFFSPRNPQSPLNTHAEGQKTEISIRSTSFLSDNTALVRFIKEQHQIGAKPVLSYWAATITFTYQNPPTLQKDREYNPLGFLVTSYRVDPESLNAVEGPAAPAVQPQQQIPQPTFGPIQEQHQPVQQMPTQEQLQPVQPQPAPQPTSSQPQQG